MWVVTATFSEVQYPYVICLFYSLTGCDWIGMWCVFVSIVIIRIKGMCFLHVWSIGICLLGKRTFLRLFMLSRMLVHWWCWWCLLMIVMMLMMSTTPSHGGFSACVCGLKLVVWLKKNMFCELDWNSCVATIKGQAGWIVMPGRSQWWSPS